MAISDQACKWKNKWKNGPRAHCDYIAPIADRYDRVTSLQHCLEYPQDGGGNVVYYKIANNQQICRRFRCDTTIREDDTETGYDVYEKECQ